jgi:hypothetical protein
MKQRGSSRGDQAGGIKQRGSSRGDQAEGIYTSITSFTFGERMSSGTTVPATSHAFSTAVQKFVLITDRRVLLAIGTWKHHRSALPVALSMTGLSIPNLLHIASYLAGASSGHTYIAKIHPYQIQSLCEYINKDCDRTKWQRMAVGTILN